MSASRANFTIEAMRSASLFAAPILLWFMVSSISFASDQESPSAKPPAPGPSAAAAPSGSPSPGASSSPALKQGAGPTSGGAPSVDPNIQPPQPNSDIFSGVTDTFDYDTRGRRDPFGQVFSAKAAVQGALHGPLLPLQKFELNQLRVTAILWNVHRPQAMIKDPGGQVHIVTSNSKIGPRNGYVAAIREGEIVVVETTEQDGRLVSTAQVVKIAK